MFYKFYVLQILYFTNFMFYKFYVLQIYVTKQKHEIIKKIF